MARSDEGMTPQHEQDFAQEERDAANEPGTQTDPAEQTAPPGNPEADDDAVEQGEEQIGKIVGR